MKNLRENKPIWHAMVWVAIYIAAMNLGAFLAEAYPAITWATGGVLAVLSIALLVYISKTGTASTYWVNSPESGTLSRALYLAPLFAIAFFQYAKGIDPQLDLGAVAAALLLVIGVAFIEELLFRGFLLQALRVKGGLNRAVIISGATFGIGHIINLANGYSGADQLIQVIAAVVIGIALAYCVAITGSIIPGVVFHALFNLSGTITVLSTSMDTYILGAVIVVMVPYIVYLRRQLASRSAAIEA